MILRTCQKCGFMTEDDNLTTCLRCGTKLPDLHEWICPRCHSIITDALTDGSKSKYCPNCLVLIDKIQSKKEAKLTSNQQIKKNKVIPFQYSVIILVIFFLVLFAGMYGINSYINTVHANEVAANAFRTAAPTPIPTPTERILPQFSRGDIVTDKLVTGSTDHLYIILDYDPIDDDYHTTFIYRNDDGSWGHWTLLSPDLYFPRYKFEKDEWVYGHIDPNQVPCGELNHDPDSVMFCKKKI